MRTLTTILLCLVISCASNNLLYQSQFRDEFDIVRLEKDLDVLMAAAMDEENIPGAALCIIKGNKVILSKAYGVRNVNGNEAVTPETVFEFASLSKPVFALSVLNLAQQGKLNLDKPLFNYLDKPNAVHEAGINR